jgi:D-arabinose 1-dehydrogenase-like Zn-dependent alcohol dehydrogenase
LKNSFAGSTPKKHRVRMLYKRFSRSRHNFWSPVFRGKEGFSTATGFTNIYPAWVTPDSLIHLFLSLLKSDATFCRVGVGKLTTPNKYGQMTTVLNRSLLAGSNAGGIRETQHMLDFCALQNIKPQITKIPMNGINDAWANVIAKQARYRFVMEMSMKG